MGNSNKDLKTILWQLEEEIKHIDKHYRHSVINRINSFLDLEENWDSYGAKCIEKETVNRAIEFYEHILEHIPHLPEPFVCPDCNGAISFNWSIPYTKEWKRSFRCDIPENPNEKHGWLETQKDEGQETIRKSGWLQSMSRLLKVIKDWAGEPPSGGFK
jgi:hypothetical protein